MTNIVPRILGFVLFVLGAAIFLTEVMHSYHRFVKQSEEYSISNSNTDDAPTKKKQMKAFFSLYHNMDELKAQNSDVSFRFEFWEAVLSIMCWVEAVSKSEHF